MSEEKFTQDEIAESFDEAIDKGEVTDLMGNKLIEADLQNWETTENGQVDFEQALEILKGAQGKVLTIIDATIDDDRKRKYVKDLIKEAFNSQADWLFELTHVVTKAK